VAQQLAQQGYQVVAVCRKAEAAKAAAEALPGSGHQGIAMDLGNLDENALKSLKGDEWPGEGLI